MLHSLHECRHVDVDSTVHEPQTTKMRVFEAVYAEILFMNLYLLQIPYTYMFQKCLHHRKPIQHAFLPQ